MNEATLEFIRIHADEDVRQLAFLGKKHPEVDMAYALDQIAGRQKYHRGLLSMESCIHPIYLWSSARANKLPDIKQG